jgi:glucose-1-phosphatase
MVKNIIFDLGGVILNIDFKKSIEAFRKLGIANIDEIFSGYVQSNFFDTYDKGLVPDIDFIIELKKYIPSEVTNEQVLHAWNAMILDFPADRIELLKKLKNKYRLFLLSNTNSIHFPVYNKQLQEIYGISDLSRLFEKAYYSFKIGMRKPDAEIFRRVINENKLIPEETLFIDDALFNIEAAEKLGLRTMLFDASHSLDEAVAESIKIA